MRCLTKACILTLPHNPPFPDGTNFSSGRGEGGGDWGCLTQAFILTLPYNPPLPISTPMSLQSSQMGTNFSGGNGVFDSYGDKTNNLDVS